VIVVLNGKSKYVTPPFEVLIFPLSSAISNAPDIAFCIMTLRTLTISAPAKADRIIIDESNIIIIDESNILLCTVVIYTILS
jgi:hypothetical protein